MSKARPTKLFYASLFLMGAILPFAPTQANAGAVSAGMGPQYAKYATTLASKGACSEATTYINLAKTDPYYVEYYQAKSGVSDYRDQWLLYRYSSIINSINNAATKVKKLCANNTNDLGLTDTGPTKEEQAEASQSAGNAKQYAQQAVTYAQAGKCEQAEGYIEKAKTSMSTTAGYVGNGVATTVIEAMSQVRSLCVLQGEAATEAAVANAATSTAMNDSDIISANATEATRRMSMTVSMAQSAVGFAQSQQCSNAQAILPLLTPTIKYYKDGKVTTMTNNSVAVMAKQVRAMCPDSSSSSTGTK